jgi:hypothetical protein
METARVGWSVQHLLGLLALLVPLLVVLLELLLGIELLVTLLASILVHVLLRTLDAPTVALRPRPAPADR